MFLSPALTFASLYLFICLKEGEHNVVAVTDYRTVEMTKIYGTQTDEDTQIREDMIGQWTVMAFYPK